MIGWGCKGSDTFSWPILISRIFNLRKSKKTIKTYYIVFSVYAEKFGENSYGGTPGHISNPEVKPINAEGTWWEAARENKNLPSQRKRSESNGSSFFIFNLKDIMSYLN